LLLRNDELDRRIKAAVNMPYNATRALELLRLGTQNPKAAFRDGQEEAIQYVVDGKGRLLVVQRTGWGKSSVYFIAANLLREQGQGPAILISPLLSLMRNQIEAAKRMGVRAFTIHSGNTEEWDAVELAIKQDEVDILLISPERLGNERFRCSVLAPAAQRISLLVVDEAHCISDWGHDFRPHYRFITNIVRTLPKNLRLLATTATANNRVLDDLGKVLGPNLEVSRGDLSRPSLLLQTIQMPSQAERLAWLAQHIPTVPGSGIIYTLTVRDSELVAKWLRLHGVDAKAYSGESNPKDRVELEIALLGNEVKVLVATTALGMGFDKPDLAFVIHFQMPGSVVHYYQQVGRAGRNLAAAYGVLLSGEEEMEIGDYFIESAFPSRADVENILKALEAEDDGLTVNELMDQVNVSKGRIDKALLLLSLESPAPIAKEGTKWKLTVTELSPSFWERAERLTALRRGEQKQMQEYVQLKAGHMEFLIKALDGDPSSYRQPRLKPLPNTVDEALVRKAVTYLRRSSLSLDPRKMWPAGGLPMMQVKGKIKPEHQAQPGKVLCMWGDAGWGTLVRKGKHDGQFSDDLVTASVDLIRKWAPQPAPEWVTCVPSFRHPKLVPSFAKRLAKTLGLPFHTVLEKTDNRPAQKTMANSHKQAANLDGSLAVSADEIPTGPVLLVDDLVDSKWTLTVAAYLLTSNGSGPVYPLALASTANSDE
jgi:ATP-dependent DNA helicase RecQ